MVESLYCQTQITVLMVSHETSVLPCACRRLALLSEGRVLADGRTEEVLSQERLRQAYRADLRVAELAGRKYIVNGTGDPAAGGTA
jgi:iron complex transport system ATP-binding protein